MPTKIAPPTTNVKVFKARRLTPIDCGQSTTIYRAVCTRCAWEYQGGEGVHELLVMSHAAGHSYKANHEIRFEAIDGIELRL